VYAVAVHTLAATFRGGPARQLPRASTYKGFYDVTGIIGNTVLVNPGVQICKRILESYP